jgi:hypothetical protein
MEFAYLVLHDGKVVDEKTCIVPDVMAFEMFLADKEVRHLNRNTGFTFIAA